jgi:hypothetical protein
MFVAMQPLISKKLFFCQADNLQIIWNSKEFWEIEHQGILFGNPFSL